VAIDARVTASDPRGSGVAGSVASLVRELQAIAGLRLHVYRASPVPIIGPHLLMPMQARLRGADVFHGPAHGLPLARFGLPGVVTINDLAIYDHPEWFPDRQWISTRVLVPRSVRGARMVICPSEATRQAVMARFPVPDDRCRVIPHGVDAGFAVPVSAADRANLQAQFGLPDRFILQVGTVQPRKNHVATLRALAAIPEPDRVPLVVAGEFGWKFEPVLRTVQELALTRWVRFVGYVEPRRLPALYQLATVLAFPSLDEGFGLPVLEAFAAGTPVVASDVGAISEVAGDAAVLVPVDDTAALASALQAVLTDVARRAELVERGRRRVAAYSWTLSAQAHARAYREAAGRPAAAPTTSMSPPAPS
jgi:glycosyltransferase involved in cell wall biosynthesis